MKERPTVKMNKLKVMEITVFTLAAVGTIVYSFFSDAIFQLKDQPLIIRLGVIAFFLGAVYFAIAIAWFFYCRENAFQPKYKLCHPAGNLIASLLILMTAFVLFTLALV